MDSRHALLVATTVLVAAVMVSLLASAVPSAGPATASSSALRGLSLDETRAQVLRQMGPSCHAGRIMVPATSRLHGATYALWDTPEGFAVVVFTPALSSPGTFQRVMDGGNLLEGAFAARPGVNPRGVSCASGGANNPFGDPDWVNVTAAPTSARL